MRSWFARVAGGNLSAGALESLPQKKGIAARGGRTKTASGSPRRASYMVRLDDLVACYKCRKRIELTGQSTVLINETLGDPNADPENFGNR